MMNQDIEYPARACPPRSGQIKQPTGFESSHQNTTTPGLLKNLIDWLSRPVNKEERQVLIKKRIAISGASAGMGGTLIAQDLLVMLLSMLNARVMNMPKLAIANVAQQADEAGKLQLTTSLPYLQKQADAFLKFLEE